MTHMKPDCQIIGAGRAGSAIARAMTRTGYRFTWVGSRIADDAERLAKEIGAGAWGVDFSSFPRPAGFLVIAVPDDNITDVAFEAAEKGIVERGTTVAAHLSGSLGSDVLESLHRSGASVMAFHPAQTFTPETDSATAFTGIVFDMEGDDGACVLGERVAADLGASAVRLSAEQRAMVHIALTASSNYTVSLLYMAADIMSRAGLSSHDAVTMLEALVRASIDNVFERGAVASLTGPVSRGDSDIVERHLERLEAIDSDYAHAYRSLARIALRMAVERGDVDGAAADKIRGLLKNGGE